jgi:hypothetical protein
VKGIQFFLNKGPGPLQRGDHHKNVNIGWGILKIFSRTTGPFLTRLGTNRPWGKWIQVCPNEGERPSPRGGNSTIKGSGTLQRKDNHKNIKLVWGHLKILFLRTMKPEKVNFT